MDLGGELGGGKRGKRGNDGGDIGGICESAYGTEEVTDNTDVIASTEIRDVAGDDHGAQKNCECGFAEVEVKANEMNGISNGEETVEESAEIIMEEMCVVVYEDACEVGREVG